MKAVDWAIIGFMAYAVYTGCGFIGLVVTVLMWMFLKRRGVR